MPHFLDFTNIDFVDEDGNFHFQNGQTLVDLADKRLSELKIPKELLLRVFLMRCIDNPPDCTNPGSMVTDFNIWNRALEKDELVKWTTCKYADYLELVKNVI